MQEVWQLALMIGTIIVLIYESIKDVKTKEIDKLAILVVGLMSVLKFIFTKNLSGKDLIEVGVVSLALIAYSKMTNQELGIGDALLIGALGISEKFIVFIEMIFIAFLVCALFGVVIYGIKRIKDIKLAFSPFLLVSYITINLIN